MSASASKKKRKELDQGGLSPKFQEAQKTKQAQKRNNLLFICVAVLAVAAIVGLAFAIRAKKYAPDYDVKAPVATVGERSITVPEYDYFYNATASNYAQMYMQFGMIQANVPLAEQQYGEDQTWEDFFKENTNTSVEQVLNIYDAAVKAGYTLTDDDKTAIDTAVDNLKTEAESYGADLKQYMNARFGSGCDLDSYRHYLEIIQTYSGYVNQMNETFKPTAEEVAAEYAENPDDYDLVSYSYKAFSAEGDTDDDGNTTYTDEAKQANQAEAEALAAELPKAETLPEGVSSATYNKANAVGTLNEAAVEWLFDAGRKAGDTELFPDDEGVKYIVVRFDGRDTNDYQRAMAFVTSISKAVDENAEEGTPTPEDKLAVFDEALKGGMSTEDYAALLEANSYNSTASAVSRQSYTAVEGLQDFLYDTARKEGDIQRFEDANYYYIVRFDHMEETTYQYSLVESALESKAQEAWFNEASAVNTITLDEELLAHANTNLTFYSNTTAQ